MAKKTKRLYRSEKDVIIGGVCGGIAEVYDLDPTIVRIIAVLVALLGFTGALIYLVLWIVTPTKSEVVRRK